jgi:hypothetical protein
VQAAWAAEPYQSGTIHYYCDCGTGAEAGCAVGNNANSGLTPALARRTIGQAATDFLSLSSGDTIALCKGGAFNTSATITLGSSGRCATGVACNDFREYTPSTFTGTAKPLINYSGGQQAIALSQYSNETSGVRILNISLKGVGAGVGVFNFNQGSHPTTRDIVIGNVTIENFVVGIQFENSGPLGPANNVVMTGNTLIGNLDMALLGIANNSSFSYNYLLNNGNNTVFNHSIYLSANSPLGDTVNFDMIGNYIYGQSSATCVGGSVIGHGNIDGLNVKDNWIEVSDADTTAQCWGLSFNSQDAYPNPEYFRNAVFSGNTIINGGNKGFDVSVCPGCVIENNVIIFNAITADTVAIDTAVVPVDGGGDVNNANIIRNNTVYFGPNTTGYGKRGIFLHQEGTGHIISNNVVYYEGTSGSVTCFDLPLASASYAFINNNHCFSKSSLIWEASRGSLASWQNYTSSYGFDTNSISGSDPLFTNAPTDFKPAIGSPLIGAGNNSYKSTVDKSGNARPSPPAIGAYEP